MSSKQILDEGKTADGLIEAARTHAADIASRRVAQYASIKLKNAPTAAAIESQIRLDATLLEHTLASLRRADEVLAAELGDDAAVFAARDRYAASVRSALVGFRDLVLTNCGDAAVAALGFVGETPRDPVALEALGASVLAGVEKSPPRSQRRLDRRMQILAHRDLRGRRNQRHIFTRQDGGKIDHAPIECDFIEIRMAPR